MALTPRIRKFQRDPAGSLRISGQGPGGVPVTLEQAGGQRRRTIRRPGLGATDISDLPASGLSAATGAAPSRGRLVPTTLAGLSPQAQSVAAGLATAGQQVVRGIEGSRSDPNALAFSTLTPGQIANRQATGAASRARSDRAFTASQGQAAQIAGQRAASQPRNLPTIATGLSEPLIRTPQERLIQRRRLTGLSGPTSARQRQVVSAEREEAAGVERERSRQSRERVQTGLLAARRDEEQANRSSREKIAAGLTTARQQTALTRGIQSEIDSLRKRQDGEDLSDNEAAELATRIQRLQRRQNAILDIEEEPIGELAEEEAGVAEGAGARVQRGLFQSLLPAPIQGVLSGARAAAPLLRRGLNAIRGLGGAGSPRSRTFTTAAEAERSGLPSGTEVIIDGRRAVIE